MPEISQNPVQNQTRTLLNLRDQVLNFLSMRGPSVPVEIAQGIGKDSYFVGAILSELLQAKQIKLSNAKKGGSRVYYLPGHEEKLSMLYNYLPEAEKKAFDFLKQSKVVIASQATPVERVAFESMKDFSCPIKVNGEQAWRWHLANDDEIIQQEPPKIIPEQPQVITSQERETVQQQLILQKELSQPKQKEEIFASEIENYFTAQNIQVLQKEVVRKNSESNFIIKVSSQIGPIEMFVCAKNKKSISDQDIMLAHQKGQNKRMPTLFMTSGAQSKKAKEYIEKNLKGYLMFRKL